MILKCIKEVDMKSKFLDARRITPKQSYVTGFREIFYLFVKEEGQLPIFSKKRKRTKQNIMLQGHFANCDFCIG